MKKRVFISYSYQDKKFVDWLKYNLANLEIDFGDDQKKIYIGHHLEKNINERISSSDAFIIVLSSASINSEWIKYEINSALLLNATKQGITILPIIIDKTQIPADLSRYLFIDFSVDKRKGLEYLRKSLLSRKKIDYKFTNWPDFNPITFENFISELLGYEGVNILRTSPTKDVGYDFIATNQNGSGETEKIIIELKLYKYQKITIDILRKIHVTALIENIKKILLITNSELTDTSRNFLKQYTPNIIVWEGHELIQKLFLYPTLIKKYFSTTEHSLNTNINLIDTELKKVQNLIKKLDDCPEGIAGWKVYEDLCIEILTYLFVPPLAAPKIQSRRESGIDIRDAIFPNRNNNENWKFIRDDYDAKYIVFEFKNYSETGSEIDKQVVLQTNDYLKRTIGRFGIICSKKNPNQSGYEKRKDIYIENDKLILFITNENLKEMLLRKYKKMDPSDVIIDLIDDFNLKF